MRNVMPSTLPNHNGARHLERLENGPRHMAKADLKNLEIAWKEKVGHAVERAVKSCGLTQKECWALLGHNDGSQLSRWINGTERPQFDALFAVEILRQPLVVALAELAGAGIELETTIRIRRRA